MFTINIDSELLAERLDLAGATERQIAAARTSALRKMRKRIQLRVKQRAAKELRLPQRAIEDRFFSSDVKPGDEEVSVWIGTWAVSPYSIGTPNQGPRGVKAGRRNYRGAFIARIYSEREQVWIRRGSRHFSPELYPTAARLDNRSHGAEAGRFPVVRAAVPIDAVLRRVLERDGAEIGAEFERLYLQELNYQTNVKRAN